ncbi:bifunctional precorrin-2 dehydrogenase/sirohydrochlorin ferrochelatase [Thiomicrorhabdus sp. ZW0627]|uniref:precorrin-2 dehydrogenase/sirohydrochlorin ferrochelatase family protein n=1 Tax=Thiomicrorhabdus sp. ZW0627 TaxID=3039774 RepID=UPI002436BFF0|nr:bifunctional precorrin-2 dehydrogenase/sirohydrochlorin ferrochelatase [Thiomicrorhabdus sp. ZW0627]MDG6774715.1 bifunctional precorrin-2 dehydrogenase/sirohydrochlorin ferrochelatase [Thiomicrorhabdus sp. ZW0627]
MGYLPIWINIKNEHCLVVGGGSIAARRADQFIKAGAIVTVIAPELKSEMKHHLANGDIVWDVDTFSADTMAHLPHPKYVISAIEDDSITQAVFRYCKHHNIPINVAGQAEICDFMLPAIIDL